MLINFLNCNSFNKGIGCLRRMEHFLPKEAVQQVHDSLTEMVKNLANEPSMGLYFVQQHVHKAVPAAVSLQEQLVKSAQSMTLNTEDAKDALQTLKIMKEIGPPVVVRMLKILGAANDLIQPLQLARRVKYQFNIINKASSKVPILPGQTLLVEESVAKIDHKNQENFSSDITVKIGEPGSVSLTASEKQPVGYMRSVLESARQHAGWPGNVNSIERGPSGTLIGSVHSKPISYMRAVFDTAFQKAELVSSETSGQNEMSVNTPEEIQSKVVLPSEDTYKQFQVEHIPKLEAWLEDSDTATN